MQKYIKSSHRILGLTPSDEFNQSDLGEISTQAVWDLMVVPIGTFSGDFIG